MDVCVGDKVQIVDGGMDVTNGLKAKGGKMYGENGPLWATVVLIDENWKTGGKFGLPSTVTKVRCEADTGVIVWQVQPKDIAPNVIRKTTPTPDSSIQATDLSPWVWKEDYRFSSGYGQKKPETDTTPKKDTTTIVDQKVALSGYPYAPEGSDWTKGGKITFEASSVGRTGTVGTLTPKTVSQHPMKEEPYVIPSTGGSGFRPLNSKEKRSIGAVHGLEVEDTAIRGAKCPTVWQDPSKRALLLDDKMDEIQNQYGFPYGIPKSSQSLYKMKEYDFQIIPGDPRFAKMITLEDKLQAVRTSVGLPVHGNNSIARAMKYYMYNRFKTPDINLAHNKTVTYVFFSRPDLNLLSGNGVVDQVLNHTEGALVWRRYPELLKLLTDCRRCGDSNNFNMLLSNQVDSFDIRDEELSTIEAGKSWNEYTMPYGDGYTGRTGGEFSCNFVETSDYSVINLIKLWVTYIDNVSRGAWRPSYNLGGIGAGGSHIFTRTLDYAASAYIFKCGPDGEDVLYWSKYYGVFPISTGAGALSWDNSASIGTSNKLNIRFRYAWKKDLSPVSLLEFNRLGLIEGAQISEDSYNPEVAGSSRPFVGTPFIGMYLANPSLNSRNDGGKTLIRLRFKKSTDTGLSDREIFRASLT